MTPKPLVVASVRDIVQESGKAGARRGDSGPVEQLFRPGAGAWRSGLCAAGATLPAGRRDRAEDRLYRPRRGSCRAAVGGPLRRHRLGRRRRCGRQPRGEPCRRGPTVAAARKRWLPDRPGPTCRTRLSSARSGRRRRPLAVPLPQGFSEPARRRGAFGLAGGLQHGLRSSARRAAARCWCPSPRAARPNRRRAPSAWSSLGSPG